MYLHNYFIKIVLKLFLLLAAFKNKNKINI